MQQDSAIRVDSGDAFQSHLAAPPPDSPPIWAPLSVIGSVVPKLLSKVSPGDAPIILYHTTAITTTWFDSIAPYNDKSRGIYSQIQKYKGEDNLDAKRSTSILYASQKLLNGLLPEYSSTWSNLLEQFGLDPDNNSTDPNTPAGIGNLAAKNALSSLKEDGMNFQGNKNSNGMLIVPQPFVDTTGYKPVNSATELSDPRRWQPDIITNGIGTFSSQVHATPQYSVAKPYSYKSPSIRVDSPSKSFAIVNGWPLKSYKDQAKEVLSAQRELTDYSKVEAEFFDDKIKSLGFSAVAAAMNHGLDLEQFVQFDTLANIAAYDTGIEVWSNKLAFDSVRPFTAIEYLYGDEKIKAWGGPGNGIVDNVTGIEWRPYLQTANHSEYPSATAAFAKAHAYVVTEYLDRIIGLSPEEANDLSFWVPEMPIVGEDLKVLRGTSSVEPGFTPQETIILGWDTWDEFANDAGESRINAGVHFPSSVPAGQEIGNQVGQTAANWFFELIGSYF